VFLAALASGTGSVRKFSAANAFAAAASRITKGDAHRINGIGKPLVLALHPLPAGELAIAR
jgi:hypothetical protein